MIGLEEAGKEKTAEIMEVDEVTRRKREQKARCVKEIRGEV
jgi:hypothetical protein